MAKSWVAAKMTFYILQKKQWGKKDVTPDGVTSPWPSHMHGLCRDSSQPGGTVSVWLYNKLFFFFKSICSDNLKNNIKINNEFDFSSKLKKKRTESLNNSKFWKYKWNARTLVHWTEQIRQTVLGWMLFQHHTPGHDWKPTQTRKQNRERQEKQCTKSRR